MRPIVILITFLIVFSQRLDPDTIPKFKSQISISYPAFKSTLNQTTHRQYYDISVKEIQLQILPAGFPKTKVYAYGGSSYDPITGSSLGVVHCVPGPSFLLPLNTQVTTTWQNTLTGKHMFAIEKNLNFMYDVKDFDNFIPTIAHAHGMANPTTTDGNAAAWFTSHGEKGHQYYSQNSTQQNKSTITWINQQQQGTLLYHDHSMAMTRLNLHAGLYGFLIIQDPLSPLSQLFDKHHDLLLAITDVSFNNDGSLFYPAEGQSEKFPVWTPQFYGDVVMVNGKVWPNMNVERNLYRVRILNVCNSRIMTVGFVVEGNEEEYLPFWLYKADISYYEEALEVTEVELPVAGRVEIVVDFTKVPENKRVIMKNFEMFNNKRGYRHHHHASNLKKHESSSTVDTTNLIMSFTPTPTPTRKILLPTTPSTLNPHLSQFPIPAPSVVNRYNILIEAFDDQGSSIGTFIDGIGMDLQPDVFQLSKIYDIYLINLTPDIHPMHFHLANFQYYKNAEIDVERYTEDWFEANGGRPPYSQKPVVMPVEKYLRGDWNVLGGVKRVWRDVDNVEPGMVAVFRIRWRHNNGQPFGFNTRIGEYIWHCHILEHQDNQMMRPFVVV